MSSSEPDISVLDRAVFAAEHMTRVEYEHKDRPCRMHWQDGRGEHITEGRDLFEATEKAIGEHRKVPA